MPERRRTRSIEVRGTMVSEVLGREVVASSSSVAVSPRAWVDTDTLVDATLEPDEDANALDMVPLC
jgi:hypothetical protein